MFALLPSQVQDVCMLVTLRSAMMVAMGLDALLAHSGWKERTLARLHQLADQLQLERQQDSTAPSGPSSSPSNSSSGPQQPGEVRSPKELIVEVAALRATVGMDGGMYAKLSGYPGILDACLKEQLGASGACLAAGVQCRAVPVASTVCTQ